MELESVVELVTFSCDPRWLANFETMTSRDCDGPGRELVEVAAD